MSLLTAIDFESGLSDFLMLGSRYKCEAMQHRLKIGVSVEYFDLYFQI